MADSVISRAELSRRTKDVLEQLAKNREPVVITHYGKPEAILQAIDARKFLELVVENAEDLAIARDHAASALDAGTVQTTDELVQKRRSR